MHMTASVKETRDVCKLLHSCTAQLTDT